MKKICVIVSEGGTNLLDTNDGFVVYGAILKVDGEGVLIGDGTVVQEIANAGIEPTAYSNFEFLDALHLDPDVVYQWWQSRRAPGSRQDGFNILANGRSHIARGRE
jgi:hypothetical protein